MTEIGATAVWTIALPLTLVAAPTNRVAAGSDWAARWDGIACCEPATPAFDDESPRRSAKRWHVDLTVRTSISKLAETEQLLDRRLEIPLKFDVFNVFAHPDTPVDRKTSLGMSTVQLGVGRSEWDRWGWTWYAGFGVFADRFHQNYLTADLRVNFDYAYYYTGVRAEYYPWGKTHGCERATWRQRLRSSRPFLLTGLETGYVSGGGEGRYKLLGRKLYGDSERIRDWLLAGVLGAGWQVPIDRRWSILLAGEYSFHAYRPREYNSWRVTTGLRLAL